MTKYILFLMPSLLLSQLAHAVTGPDASEIARRQAVITGSLEKFVQLPSSTIFKQAKQKSKKLSAKLKKLTDENDSGEGTAVSDAEISACLVSTCGPSKLNFSAFNLLEARKIESVNFKTLWESDLAPLIAADMNEEFAFNASLTNLLPSALASAKLSDQQTQLLKAFVTYKDSINAVTSVGMSLMDFDTAQFKISVNEKRTAMMSSSMPPDRAKLFQLLLRRVVQPAMMARILIMFKSPLATRLQIFYPGVDDRAALLQDAQKLVLQYRELEQAYGVDASAYLVAMSATEKNLLASASKGSILNGTDADVYATIAANIDFYHLPLEGDNLKILASMDTKFDAILTRAKSNFVANLAGMTKIFDIDSAIESTQNLCREKLALQTAAEASVFKRDRARLMINEIKAAAKAVLPNFVAKQNIAAVSAQIDKTEYLFPDRGEITIEKFRTKLLQHRGFIASQANLLKGGGPDAQNFLLVTSVIRAQMQIESGTKVIQDATHSDCDNISTSTFTDFSVPPFGQISVSWATLNTLEYTVPVMSHELGHVVSNKIRNLSLAQTDDLGASFVKSLNCVANRNPFIQAEATLTKFQNTQWSEEDWADHFSVYVTQEMKSRKSVWLGDSKNFACAMLRGTDEDYMDNGIVPTEGDPHSAPLLRLFMIDADRGTLAPACRKLFQPAVCQ